METSFLYSDTQLSTYYQFPKFLLSGDLGLSQTARIAYMLLYDRTRLSMVNGWVDEMGHVFIRYTCRNLAKALGKGITAAKNALKELVQAGLLYREHGGFGQQNILYVKIPNGTVSWPDEPVFRPGVADFRPPLGQFSGSSPDGFPAPNKNNMNKNNMNKNYNNKALRAPRPEDYYCEEGESF